MWCLKRKVYKYKGIVHPKKKMSIENSDFTIYLLDLSKCELCAQLYTPYVSPQHPQCDPQHIHFNYYPISPLSVPAPVTNPCEFCLPKLPASIRASKYDEWFAAGACQSSTLRIVGRELTVGPQWANLIQTQTPILPTVQREGKLHCQLWQCAWTPLSGEELYLR